MRIKKMLSICTKSKIIRLYGRSPQWLSDGSAMFPLFDMPIFTEGSFAATFNIDINKFEDIRLSIDMPTGIDVSDTDDNEKITSRGEMKINYLGIKLIPIYTSTRIRFIQEKYLEPVADMDNIWLYERCAPNGKTYFVVKKGMMVCGVIMPIDIIDKEFMDSLTNLYQQCYRSAEMYETSGNLTNEQMQMMFTDIELEKESNK